MERAPTLKPTTVLQQIVLTVALTIADNNRSTSTKAISRPTSARTCL